MEVNFAPELQAKLNESVAITGRPADKLVQDAVAGYSRSHYDDIRNGKVHFMDGDEARVLLKAKTAEQTRSIQRLFENSTTGAITLRRIILTQPVSLII